MRPGAREAEMLQSFDTRDANAKLKQAFGSRLNFSTARQFDCLATEYAGRPRRFVNARRSNRTSRQRSSEDISRRISLHNEQVAGPVTTYRSA